MKLITHCFKFPKTFQPYGVVSQFLMAIGRNISVFFITAIFPDIFGANSVYTEIFQWPVISVKRVTDGLRTREIQLRNTPL